MNNLRKKKKYNNSCVVNDPCTTKKETKKCEPCKKQEPVCSCGPCEDLCEIKFDDTCVKLAQEAEKLFQKALNCECLAVESFEEAKEYDNKAKALEDKARKLAKESQGNEAEAQKLRKQANELICKSDELCAKAKCLYKEAEAAGNEAEQYCQKAKCLYEQAQSENEKAKCLYSQAMNCDEKAMNCYKAAGEKIKEYESKSKKCEDMMKKCQSKLGECANNMNDCGNLGKSCYIDLGIDEPCKCKPTYGCDNKATTDCGCKSQVKNNCSYNKPEKEMNYNCNYNYYTDKTKTTKPTTKKTNCEANDIFLIKEEETGLYINPIYNMEPMQYMGDFSNKYPSMDYPYMDMGMCMNNQMGMEDMQDMWMNYYMMMQNMMMQNMMGYQED